MEDTRNLDRIVKAQDHHRSAKKKKIEEMKLSLIQ